MMQIWAIELAERLYRIANFAPEDRDRPLTEMDMVGLTETILAVDEAMREQDEKTSWACSAAVEAIAGSVVTVPEGRSSPYVHQLTASRVCRETSAI